VTGPRRLVVGRIVKPHGIRGEVVVDPLSDAPDRFAPGARLSVGGADDPGRTVTVVSSRTHQGRLLVRFDEVRDRSEAEAARGGLLWIAGANAFTPQEGSWLLHEIEGCRVVSEDGEEIGTVAEVLGGTANDVWALDAGGRRILVPAVRDVVVDVNPAERRITIRVLPGLLE
jgi:16S rRNA processing protein RimM